MSRSETVKRVRELHQRKFREERRLFLVQGRKMVAELLASSFNVETVYASAEVAATIKHPRVQVMPGHDLERMGTFETGNEVIAVVRLPDTAAPGPVAQDGLMLALDGVNDPGNVGTLLRVADRFGVQSVLLGLGTADVFNPKCVQASMGSIFRVPAFEVDLPAALSGMIRDGTRIYRAEMNGESVFQAALLRPSVLVLGNESHGISGAVRAVGGVAITIPQFGGAESLNVATAAAALCMEFARRTLVD